MMPACARPSTRHWRRNGCVPGMNGQVQCSCNGGNPSCYKCGGWGYIDSIAGNRIGVGPAGDAGKQNLPARLEKLKGKLRPATRRRSKKALSGAPASSAVAMKEEVTKVNVAAMSHPLTSKIIRCTCGAWVAVALRGEHSCATKKSRKGQGKKGRSVSPGQHREIKVEDARLTRSLDATLGYSRPFREGGAFGSHPSHDDHGDESSA